MQRTTKRIIALALAIIMAVSAIGLMPAAVRAEDNGYGYVNEYLPYQPDEYVPYVPEEDMPYIPEEYLPYEPEEDILYVPEEDESYEYDYDYEEDYDYEDDGQDYDEDDELLMPLFDFEDFGAGLFWTVNVEAGGRLDVIVSSDPVQNGINLQNTINDPGNDNANIFVPNGTFHVSQLHNVDEPLVPQAGQTITGASQGGVRIYDRIPGPRGADRTRALVLVREPNVTISNLTLVGPDVDRSLILTYRNPSAIRLDGNVPNTTFSNLSIDATNTRAAFTLVDAHGGPQGININNVTVTGVISDDGGGAPGAAAGTGAVVMSTSTGVNINGLNLSGMTVTQHGPDRHYADVILCSFFEFNVGFDPRLEDISISGLTPSAPDNFPEYELSLRLPEPGVPGAFIHLPSNYDAARGTVDFASLTIPGFPYILIYEDGTNNYVARFFRTPEEAQAAAIAAAGRGVDTDTMYRYTPGQATPTSMEAERVIATVGAFLTPGGVWRLWGANVAGLRAGGGLRYGTTATLRVIPYPAGTIIPANWSVEWESLRENVIYFVPASYNQTFTEVTIQIVAIGAAAAPNDRSNITANLLDNNDDIVNTSSDDVLFEAISAYTVLLTEALDPSIDLSEPLEVGIPVTLTVSPYPVRTDSAGLPITVPDNTTDIGFLIRHHDMVVRWRTSHMDSNFTGDLDDYIEVDPVGADGFNATITPRRVSGPWLIAAYIYDSVNGIPHGTVYFIVNIERPGIEGIHHIGRAFVPYASSPVAPPATLYWASTLWTSTRPQLVSVVYGDTPTRFDVQAYPEYALLNGYRVEWTAYTFNQASPFTDGISTAITLSNHDGLYVYAASAGSWGQADIVAQLVNIATGLPVGYPIVFRQIESWPRGITHLEPYDVTVFVGEDADLTARFDPIGFNNMHWAFTIDWYSHHTPFATVTMPGPRSLTAEVTGVSPGETRVFARIHGRPVDGGGVWRQSADGDTPSAWYAVFNITVVPLPEELEVVGGNAFALPFGVEQTLEVSLLPAAYDFGHNLPDGWSIVWDITPTPASVEFVNTDCYFVRQVRAIGPYETTVTAQLHDGTTTVGDPVEFTLWPVPIGLDYVSGLEYTLYLGGMAPILPDSATLEVEINPNFFDTDNLPWGWTLDWYIYDETVATMVPGGLTAEVTAVGAGNTQVTATLTRYAGSVHTIIERISFDIIVRFHDSMAPGLEARSDARVYVPIGDFTQLEVRFPAGTGVGAGWFIRWTRFGDSASLPGNVDVYDGANVNLTDLNDIFFYVDADAVSRGMSAIYAQLVDASGQTPRNVGAPIRFEVVTIPLGIVNVTELTPTLTADGSQVRFEVRTNPADFGDLPTGWTVRWTSDDPAVVSIPPAFGLFEYATALAPGSAIITAQVYDASDDPVPGMSVPFIVTVDSHMAFLRDGNENQNVELGDTLGLAVRFILNGQEVHDPLVSPFPWVVTWRVHDDYTDYASVNPNTGVVTGLLEGTALVIATLHYNGVYQAVVTFNVTVVDATAQTFSLVVDNHVNIPGAGEFVTVTINGSEHLPGNLTDFDFVIIRYPSCHLGGVGFQSVNATSTGITICSDVESVTVVLVDNWLAFLMGTGTAYYSYTWTR